MRRAASYVGCISVACLCWICVPEARAEQIELFDESESEATSGDEASSSGAASEGTEDEKQREQASEASSSDETREGTSGDDSGDETSSDTEDETSDEASTSEGDLVIETLGSGASASEHGSGPSSIPGRAAGRITLEFDRRSGAILVPARMEGRSVYFIFDTGATYTTLTPSFAREVGVMPDGDAPNTVVRTAGGPVQTRYGVLSRLYLGSRAHTSVTFSLCEPCGHMHGEQRVVGLLGRNVLRRYEAHVNEAEGVVELTPNAAYDSRRADVEPWLEVQHAGVRTVEEQGEIVRAFRASVHNRASRSIRELVLKLTCTTGEGRRETARTEPIRLSAESSDHAVTRVRGSCRRIEWELAGAIW